MVGKTLSHYQVLEQIGEGGMGVVYRARDLHLERDVAMKVLSTGMRDEPDLCERLRGEALALSQLNHPNIGTIYDYDSFEGQTFFTMEFLPGGTLAELIARGPIPLGPATQMGLQIAQALEAAHDQGVLHRDLKPANILLSARGDIKVVDFGLARSMAISETAVTQTSNLTPAGTLAYMSPEQLLGRTLDARSDLYTLGVVLFEMLTGRRPHIEGLSTALVNAIVNQPPPAPRSINQAIPEALEALVLRLLEKHAPARFARAGDVAQALRKIPGAQPDLSSSLAPLERETTRSLAVLPLTNLSLDPEEEFFADGMTESLISDLSQIEGLRVISRTSCMRYKGTRKALSDIARELRVDTVLEGSVLRSGDRVRISVGLVEAASDRNLWTRRYESRQTDVLALQGEVAEAVAREIRVQLSPRAEGRLRAGRTVTLEAHEAYLRGRQMWNRRTSKDVMQSIVYFQEAIALAPTWAQAWSGLADAYVILGNMNVMSPDEAHSKGRAAAERAVELDPGSAEAQTSLAYMQLEFEWDWSGAEAGWRKAIQLNPNYATAHQWLATVFEVLGRTEEGLHEIHLAEELDPLAPIMQATKASVYYYGRRFEEAVQVGRHALATNPTFIASVGELARALEQAGQLDAAIGAYRRHAELTDMDPMHSSGLAHAFALAGREAESRAILDRLLLRRKEQFVSCYAIGSIYAGLKETGPALDWLERACAERDRTVPYLSVNPRFDTLQPEPRFQALLRRMKLA